MVKLEFFTMKTLPFSTLALLAGLLATTAQACPITLVIGDAARSAQPLRADFERSEYRDQDGRWRSLAGRCEPGPNSVRCRLETRCGPHQFLLRVEWLTGTTTAAVLERAALFPQAGWMTLQSDQTVHVDAGELRSRVMTEAGVRRVRR